MGDVNPIPRCHPARTLICVLTAATRTAAWRVCALAGMLIALCLFGTTGWAGPCSRPSRVDLPSAVFSNAGELPFRLPLDETTDAETLLADFAAYGSALACNRKYHAAEDFSRPAGASVYAVADGRISFSGRMEGYGWLITIDHAEANLYSLYGHLSPSRWHKRSGTVTKGELIGYIGDRSENGSSRRYGEIPPHLHLGTRAGRRADYPSAGEWRWQAGWVRTCPEELGWLQPSVIITTQAIPAGGFAGPAVGFLTRFRGEILLLCIFAVGGACVLVFAFRRNKRFILLLLGVVTVAAAWLANRKGMHASVVLLACGGA
jgi:hypothetical protein